jgi:hypothetical protein
MRQESAVLNCGPHVVVLDMVAEFGRPKVVHVEHVDRATVRLAWGNQIARLDLD